MQKSFKTYKSETNLETEESECYTESDTSSSELDILNLRLDCTSPNHPRLQNDASKTAHAFSPEDVPSIKPHSLGNKYRRRRLSKTTLNSKRLARPSSVQSFRFSEFNETFDRSSQPKLNKYETAQPQRPPLEDPNNILSRTRPCEALIPNEVRKAEPKPSHSSVTQKISASSEFMERQVELFARRKVRHIYTMAHNTYVENNNSSICQRMKNVSPYGGCNSVMKSPFPFTSTPSGNLKVTPNQVVFESRKVSVLVADPTHTKVDVKGLDGPKPVTSFMSLTQGSRSVTAMPVGVGEKNDSTPTSATSTSSESDEDTDTVVISSEPIDWSRVQFPEKKDLYKLLHHRIMNHVKPDCRVRVGNKDFLCHILVLQCYSKYFDQMDAKEVVLPEDEVTERAFPTIYDWMKYPETDSYKLLRRDNILEVFKAARYLGVKELEDQCWAFIDSEDIFSEDTAFLLFMNARKNGNADVTSMMLPRIMKFFLTLVSSKNFLDLTVEELVQILGSSYISVHCEIEVFMSGVRWLMHDWKERRQHAVKVMRCVRFGLVNPWQLVDVRHNPENPEFIKLLEFPEVRQMVDEGICYAIMKRKCGTQTQEYTHWKDILGLEEPTPRNWIGDDITYVTYKEFLKALEEYRGISRRVNAQDPKPSKPQQRIGFCLGDGVTAVSSQHQSTSYQPIPSGLPDFKYDHPSTTVQPSTSSYPPQPTIAPEQPHRVSFGYHSSHKTSPPSVDLPTPPIPTRKMIREYHDSRNLSEVEEEVDIQNYDTDPLDRNPGEPQPRDSLNIGQKQEEKAINVYNVNMTQPPSTEFPLRGEDTTSFPDITKTLYHSPLHPQTTRLSTSILGPSNKNYTAEGSLFLMDRESVLVFGGIDPHSEYGFGRNTGKDIYRYHPETNVWEHVGELPEPRHHHSVAFLKGRVFLVGGADPRDDDVRGKSVVVSTVWSFEPVTRSWFSESGMLTPRKNFGLVVSNGKLYAIGGQDRKGMILDSVERFDPATGSWEEVCSLKTGRMGAAVAKFHDVIWVVGGMTASKNKQLSNKVECYDMRQNLWLSHKDIRFPRVFGKLFPMNDTLYLIGGAGRLSEKDRTTASVSAIDVWDDHDKAWKLYSEMAIPRHGHAVAYMGTQIMILGGVTTVYMRALNNVECFCCQRGTWIRGVTNLPTTLSGHGAITLPPASYM